MADRKRGYDDDGAGTSKQGASKNTATRVPCDSSPDTSLPLLLHGGGRSSTEPQPAAEEEQEEEHAVAQEEGGGDAGGGGDAEPIDRRNDSPPLVHDAAAAAGSSSRSSNQPGARSGTTGLGRASPRPNKRQPTVDASDVAVTNRAVHAAIGGNLPTLVQVGHHPLGGHPPQAQPPPGVSAAKQHPQGTLRLDAANQPPGPTAQQRGAAPNAIISCQLQGRPLALVPAAAGQPVGAAGATGFHQPPQPPQLQPQPPQVQPLGTCPRCRIGRGTVARHHLCRCLQCPDSPVEDECPFCALASVPKLNDNPKPGMCPCCNHRPGMASSGHICRCTLCRDVPDAVCPHCALAAVPQPRPRPDGTCPCCMANPGRVATRHLCLCVHCKALPGARCPFCDLAAGQRGV